MWVIWLVPTGESNPYGRRRAALGLISAFEQLRAGGYLDDRDASGVTLPELLAFALGTFTTDGLSASTVPEVQAFIYERYRNQLAATYDRNVIDAVLALHPPLPQDRKSTRLNSRP